MKKPAVWALCFLLSFAFVHLPLYPTHAETSGESIDPTNSSQVRLVEQPFYPDLQNISNRWDRSYMGEVQGKTPEYTLLNFYGVMAKVASKIESVSAVAKTEPGIGWSNESKQTIKEAELLFASAVESLDGSSIPSLQ